MKDTKAPKGYAKDTKTYTVKVESEEVSEMTTKEEPVTDPVSLLLTKIPKGYGHDHGEGDATLQGAVYKFSYYDGQYGTAEKAEASGKATATWYFVTDANGKINGQNPVKSPDYTSSAAKFAILSGRMSSKSRKHRPAILSMVRNTSSMSRKTVRIRQASIRITKRQVLMKKSSEAASRSQRSIMTSPRLMLRETLV